MSRLAQGVRRDGSAALDLALVAAGISNKGIARELQVSPNTVKFHIAAILDKLDAFGVGYEARVLSAHRMPDDMFEYAEDALPRGLQ